jgi:diacylglycerol O-acyltransferase / trehalose O-mycolyltransferase
MMPAIARSAMPGLLPDGGPVGFYSNWWNFGLGGENWETYTATELPQILQSGFRASTAKAIAGVSTGGGAALFIAAHHPGGYAAAASYSGMDCTLLPTAVALIVATVTQCSMDDSEHLEIANDPVAMADMLNALDPAQPVKVPCLVVLPVFGPVGPVPSF